MPAKDLPGEFSDFVDMAKTLTRPLRAEPEDVSHRPPPLRRRACWIETGSGDLVSLHEDFFDATAAIRNLPEGRKFRVCSVSNDDERARGAGDVVVLARNFTDYASNRPKRVEPAPPQTGKKKGRGRKLGAIKPPAPAPAPVALAEPAPPTTPEPKPVP